MAIKKTTPKKVTSSYTTTSGQKVTKYSDGTKTYSGGSTTPAKTTSSGGSSSKTTTPVATNQSTQLEAMKQTLLKMQSDLQSGKITGLTPSPAKTTPTVTPAKTSTYSGPSIVDYLGSQGQASDFATRARLAANAGITGYAGTAEQNTALLNKLRINTSNPVPSTALTNPLSPTDVMDKRAQLESLQGQLKSKQDELAALLAASQTDLTVTDDGEVTNYDEFLTRYNTQGFEKTEAQKEQERLLNESAGTVEDFYKNRDKNVDKAYDEYGVTDKQKALGNIQKEMAEREVRLRESVKNLETAPEYRGVSREFAVDQREAIKSEGAFDLANLSIVESAYRGDLETARSLATDLIDNQFKTFEGKLEGYKARLATLIPQLNADEKQQALQLEQAFNAQTRALAEKKADTELRYEYMTLAAQAGAPESVYKAILKATSADEAFMLAAPYLQKKTTTGGTTGGGVTTPVGGITPVAGLPQGLSTSADQVLKGLKSINDFTPSEKTKVQNELGALGFNNSTPAEWFGVEFLAGQGVVIDQAYLENLFKKNYARGLPPGQLESVVQADVQKALQILWEQYRNFVFGTGGSTGGGTTTGTAPREK